MPARNHRVRIGFVNPDLKGETVKRVFVFFVLLGLLSTAMGAAGQAVPTFVGIRTFLGAPYVTKLEDLHADFAVLGVPFDEGTWGQPGERYGDNQFGSRGRRY